MVKASQIVKMSPKELKVLLRGAEKIKTVDKIRKIVEEDPEKTALVMKEHRRMIKHANKPELDVGEFKDRIRHEDNYNTLNRYRKQFEEDADRQKVLHQHLRKLSKDGAFQIKRRVAGTGTRKEVEEVYKDTLQNRKMDRVGQKYTRVIWENAEYEEAQRKIRKRKRISSDGSSAGKKRRNAWLEAVGKAKEELEAPRMTKPKKEGDPQSLECKVYARAIELMPSIKESIKAEREAESKNE